MGLEFLVLKVDWEKTLNRTVIWEKNALSMTNCYLYTQISNVDTLIKLKVTAGISTQKYGNKLGEKCTVNSILFAHMNKTRVDKICISPRVWY